MTIHIVKHLQPCRFVKKSRQDHRHVRRRPHSSQELPEEETAAWTDVGSRITQGFLGASTGNAGPAFLPCSCGTRVPGHTASVTAGPRVEGRACPLMTGDSRGRRQQAIRKTRQRLNSRHHSSVWPGLRDVTQEMTVHSESPPLLASAQQGTSGRLRGGAG